MTKTIRLVTLNISRKNPLGKRVLSSVNKKRPDIVCLQEVLQVRIDRLRQLGYTTGQVEDYQHIRKLSGYITTGVKDKASVISVEKARYYEEKINVLWGFVYTKIAKLRERHEGLVTTVRINGKLLRIVNLHLSTACGPRIRIAQLSRMLSKFADERTIFCGDFNIINDMVFKLIQGWASGYKWSDYVYDERAEVIKLLEKYGLQNPFATMKTVNLPFHLQFDYILVPNQIKILKHKMFKVPLSDHKGLIVDLEIS